MTDQNMEHPTSGRRRRHKSPPTLQCTSALPVPRLATALILRMVLRTRKVEKKRSDRSQSLLLPFLPQADFRMNTMRLWESLKWILGMKRGWIQSTMMLLKTHRIQRSQARGMCLVSPTGVMVVHHYASA